MAGWGEKSAALGAEIPQWAIRRAEELCGCNFYGDAGGVAGAFARYIAQHEQPPVDPEWEAMDAAVVAYNSAMFLVGNNHADGVSAALAAYRKHKEAGK